MMEQRGANLMAFPDILPRANEPEQNLGWEVARNVTSVLVRGREQLTTTATVAGDQLRRSIGALIDVGDDVAAYLDPLRWLSGIYDTLGLATHDAIAELDDRIDRVELRVDDAARERAREELLLLQQRIGELELLLSQVKPAAEQETRAAMGALLGRLGELETRIDSMPWQKLEA